MPNPTQLDFVALADGVVRNNVGVDAIELRVHGRIENRELIVDPTNQRFPVESAPEAAPRGWHTFHVVGWDPGATTTLVWQRSEP